MYQSRQRSFSLFFLDAQLRKNGKKKEGDVQLGFVGVVFEITMTGAERKEERKEGGSRQKATKKKKTEK